jgi:uncharacterized protein YndB with AHSA1/START domain
MTNDITTVAPVVRTIEVGAPPETCFRVFVDEFGSWWPREHHIGDDRTIAAEHVEAFVGGRMYDVDTNGGECHWGTVLAIDPPTRFTFAWHIQGDWTIDLDPDHQSEVEVTFSPLDDGRTLVRLAHDQLHRHGDGAGGMREGVAGAGGWGFLIGRAADVIEGRPPRPVPTEG